MIYRKEIDGLRALAVLPVLFYHGGFDFFSGGYVGVDVFFVISGYLITTIIYEQIREGRFSIASFYERRARRILPALFLVAVCCLPMAWWSMTPERLASFGESLAATQLFASNIYFWTEGGYFNEPSEFKPLLHTWSLAVEEQFYVLFPVALLALWAWFKTSLFGWIVLFLVLSLLASIWGMANMPSATFYLLPFRGWELLLGSACAIHLVHAGRVSYGGPKASSVPQVLSLLGICMIFFASVRFDEATSFPGLNALLPTLGAVLIILFGSKHSITGMLLSNRFAVLIGLISYSAYLWHVPLLVFARLHSPLSLVVTEVLLILAISVVLAYFSYRYIEQPFRNKEFLTRKAVFMMSACSILALLACGLVLKENLGFESRMTGSGQTYSQLNFSERLRVNAGLSEVCDSIALNSTECFTSATPQVLVWGDSVAMHHVPGLMARYPELGLAQMTKSDCPPLIGTLVRAPHITDAASGQCKAMNDAVAQWISDQGSIRFVLLSMNLRNYLGPTALFQRRSEQVAASPALLRDAIVETVQFLQGRGIEVRIVSALPFGYQDTAHCLVTTSRRGMSPRMCDVPISRFRQVEHQARSILEDLASEGYGVIDLFEILCDDVRCDAMLGDTFIYRDAVHLSHEGSRALWKLIDLGTLNDTEE